MVYDQLETYLDERKPLHYPQLVFHPKFSRDTGLIRLTYFIKFQMNKENIVCIKLMVLLDTQKAFDTVNHFILLRKLDRPKQLRAEMVPVIFVWLATTC